jgi:hypothetical protein
MILVPRHATDEEVLSIVRALIDVLVMNDYEAFCLEVGYLRAFGIPGADCIKRDLANYRSPDYYPDVEHFIVTDWRTARGGNTEPWRSVTWYKSNSSRLAGAVEFDLPLNGKWSDLSADFAFFDIPEYPDGFVLQLEEIQSSQQVDREQLELDRNSEC